MSLEMSLPLQLPAVPMLDHRAQQDALSSQENEANRRVGSLGHLDLLAVRLAGMTARADWQPSQAALLVCAGDHGIAERNITTLPRSATKNRVLALLDGSAPANVLAQQTDIEVFVLDVGVAGILPKHEYLLGEKINYGTADFVKNEAMSHGQVSKAVQAGVQAADTIIDGGADVLLLSAMGVGGSAAAVAVVAALTGAALQEIAGYEAGATDEQTHNRLTLIQDALDHHDPVTVDTLSKLGGYEIAALVGAMFGAAVRRTPVVIDGYTSAAAALVASRLDANIVQYLVAAHRSAEVGHGRLLTMLGLTPLLDLSLRQGEGIGPLLALPILRSAMALVAGPTEVSSS